MFRQLFVLISFGSLFLVSTSVAYSEITPPKEHDEKSSAKEHASEDAHQKGHKHLEIGIREKTETDAGTSKDPAEFRKDLAIFTLIVFGLLFLGLAKFAWGPIISAIDAREASVRNDIASAEDARLKAEKMLADHAAKLESVQDEVKEILAEARRDADRTKQDIITTAQTEATATKNRAVVDIERARDQALEAVFDRMNETVAMATEHVVGHGLQPEDQSRLIDEALAQFASSHSS